MEEEGAFRTDAAGSNPLLRCLRAAPPHPGGELCPGKCQPRAPGVGIPEEGLRWDSSSRAQMWACSPQNVGGLGRSCLPHVLAWAWLGVRDGQAGTEWVTFSSASLPLLLRASEASQGADQGLQASGSRSERLPGQPSPESWGA